MDDQFTLDVDMAFNSDDDRLRVSSELIRRGIHSEILQEQGPGGGNPLVRLKGTRPRLEAYVREVYCVDPQADTDLYLSIIRPSGSSNLHRKFPEFVALLKNHGLIPDCDDPMTEYPEDYLQSLNSLIQKVKEL